MSEQCNHSAHNWNVVYQCRGCNEIVPEKIAKGYLAQLEADLEDEQLRSDVYDENFQDAYKRNKQLEAENEALRKYVETYHDEDYVMWRREQDALLTGDKP